MIRAIDKGITALYQALVNASGKKPMWWGEQCCYLLLLGAGSGVARDDFPAPRWMQLSMIAVMVMLIAVLWAATSAEVLWKACTCGMAWRMVFVILFLDSMRLLLQGSAHMDAILISAGFVSFEYFLLCEDPPPPKPRTRTSLAGSH